MAINLASGRQIAVVYHVRVACVHHPGGSLRNALASVWYIAAFQAVQVSVITLAQHAVQMDAPNVHELYRLRQSELKDNRHKWCMHSHRVGKSWHCAIQYAM